MLLNEALQAAITMRNAGKTAAEIAAHLETAGYRRPQSGKPLDSVGVNAMLLKAGVRKNRRPKRSAPARFAQVKDKDAAPSKASRTTLDAIRAILQTPTIPPQERIDLALLVLK